MTRAGAVVSPPRGRLLCILPHRIEDFQDLLFERCGSTHVSPTFLSLEEAVIGRVMIRDHEVGDFPFLEDRIQKLGLDLVVEHTDLDVVVHKFLLS